MIHKQKMTLAVITIFFICIQSINCLASNTEKGVGVGYDSGSAKYYKMEVIIIGDGSVYDGTLELRNQINVYELTNKSKKTFKVAPDRGNRTKNIIYDFNDITHQINSEGKFDVLGLKKDSRLIITFEKEINEPNKPDLPVMPPINPSIPPRPNPPKDIITEIIEEIEIGKLKDGTYEDVIQSLMNGTKDYKILSHNIQNKVGRYEVLVQLKDGSIRKLVVNVVEDKEVAKDCYILILMIILLIIYTSLSLGYITKRHFEIKRLKEKELDMKQGETT